MKLGIAPPGTYGLDFFTVESLQTYKDLGFSGVTPYTGDFEQFTKAECAQVKAACEGSGVEVFELGKYLTNFVSLEPAVRAASVEETKLALERAAWMGCPVVIVGSGSLHPTDMWMDHPGNHTWRSFDYLVKSLQAAVKTAEDVGVDLAMECHTYTALDSPERVRNVVDAVDSPRLKVDLDPVNWITYATYWDNGPLIHHMFDLLSDVIMGGHAKDVRQEDGLIVHLDETYAGNGNLNYGVFLTRFAQLDPELYLMLEYCPADKMEWARDFVYAEAAKVGASFIS